MDNVISLDAHRPHKHGPAKCLACGHKWEAVLPIPGAFTDFQCPGCGLYKGVFVGLFELPEGTLHYECKCGNALFELSPDYASCPLCGGTHEWAQITGSPP